MFGLAGRGRSGGIADGGSVGGGALGAACVRRRRGKAAGADVCLQVEEMENVSSFKTCRIGLAAAGCVRAALRGPRLLNALFTKSGL